MTQVSGPEIVKSPIKNGTEWSALPRITKSKEPLNSSICFKLDSPKEVLGQGHEDLVIDSFAFYSKRATFHMTSKAWEEMNKHHGSSWTDGNGFWETNQVSKLNHSVPKMDKTLSDLSFRVYIDVDSNLRQFTLVSMDEVTDPSKPICLLFGPIKPIDSSSLNIKGLELPGCKQDGKPLWMEKTLDMNLVALRRSSDPNCCLKETIVGDKLCLAIHLLPGKTLKPRDPIYVHLNYGLKTGAKEESAIQALQTIEVTPIPGLTAKRKLLPSLESPAKKVISLDQEPSRHLNFVNTLSESIQQLTRTIALENKKQEIEIPDHLTISDMRKVFGTLEDIKTAITQLESERKICKDNIKKALLAASDKPFPS